MVRKEAKTDLWVTRQLDEHKIPFTPQGSDVAEIRDALRTASKRGTGNEGFPEFVSVNGDFVIIIEDKADTNRHEKRDGSGCIDLGVEAVQGYAVNGAYFYVKHIARNTAFKKIFGIGISGDEKHHRITPLFCDDSAEPIVLPELETLVNFSPSEIQAYYDHVVLKKPKDVAKTTAEILKDAKRIHEDLRTYGSVTDQNKPLIVAGILLALDEIRYQGFDIDRLSGDMTEGMTDGDKIMDAIRGKLNRSNVGPTTKKDKLLDQFSIIRASPLLYTTNPALGKTPLRHYAEYLYSNVYRYLMDTSEDIIGRFYGEFMSYSGGDGQSLGIILTPRHITDLMCELIDVGPDDVVLDPCCGTGGFLISAMHRMLTMADNNEQRKRIKKQQLHGFEVQGYMFAVAAANMILRGDGNSNLKDANFLAENPAEIQRNKHPTAGLMNPPYSQGSSSDPDQYELSFVEHLLDSLTIGARAAVILPQSSMTGKSNSEREFKRAIMKKHTLEGVITCNPDTFYGVGVNPVIAVFTAWEPHTPDKVCRFIDFREDGFKVHAHIGLEEENDAKDKRSHLLDVWKGRTEAPSRFCVNTTVGPTDEWLHSFYYFNDEIPTDADFERTIGDYLTFEFSMVMQNREYLFREGSD